MLQFVSALLIIGFFWVFQAIFLFYLGFRNKASVYHIAGISFFFLGLFSLLWSGSLWALSENHLRWATVCFVVSSINIALFVDYVQHESVQIPKLIIVITVGTLLLGRLWDPNITSTIILEGEPILIYDGIVLILLGTDIFLTLGVMLNWGITTIRFVPRHLRIAAWLLLLSNILFGVGITVTLTIAGMLLGITLIGIGLILLSVILFRNPELVHVLTFKVYRIIVIDSNSGISLYNHEWARGMIDEYLLAGLLKGLLDIGKEVLQKGLIREIRLEHGHLIFHQTSKVTVGILAGENSTYLKENLKQFAENFEASFVLTPDFNPYYSDQFAPANALIKKWFASVRSE